jgi:hypothetical protein
MSTLKVEMDLDNKTKATEAVQLIDCGRASERTCGVPLLILFELGIPPNDSLLVF